MSLPPGVDLSKIPIGKPPPGVTPNFVDPEDKAYQYYIVGGIGTTLMVIFVLLRFHVRFVKTRTGWWDDAACLLALLSQAAYTGVIMRLCKIAIGRHAWDVSAIIASEFKTLAKTSAILTAPAIYFTKLALLLLYMKLFTQNRLVNNLIWAAIVVCTIYYTAVMFLYIFLKAVSAQYTLTESVAAFGVVSDVYIICLPLLAISRLNLTRKKKWALLAVFLTGAVAVVMSFVGCAYRFHFVEDSKRDNTRALLRVYLVNTVEVDIGVICACLPLLAKLIRPTSRGDEDRPWWLSTLRSIGAHLLDTLRSLSPTSSRHSAESRRKGDKFNEKALGSDTVELERERDVEVGRAGAMRGKGGDVTVDTLDTVDRAYMAQDLAREEREARSSGSGTK